MNITDLLESTPRVPPQTSIEDAARVMRDRKRGLIAVTEAARIVGIFTEQDLTRRVISQGQDPATTPVSAVMTTAIAAAPGDTSLGQALEIMRARGIHHLAIVNARGQLLGTVAAGAVLDRLMQDLAGKIDDLERYLMIDGPGG